MTGRPLPPLVLPAWWFVLDIAGALLLGLGLLAWFTPGHPLAGWLPSPVALGLAIVGALLLGAATVLLLRMLIERSRHR